MKAKADPHKRPTTGPAAAKAARHAGPQAPHAALQAMIDDSPQVRAQARLQARIDTSPRMLAQRKRLESLTANPVQQEGAPEEEELQGTFATQQQPEEEELMQGTFATQHKPGADDHPAARQQQENRTGMPDGLKSQMEQSLNTDFSDVKIHANSAKAPELGALAYTQGTDVHFAPGQFKPDTTSGQELLGHELTHVVQQSEGRVQPTTEVQGVPVNDSPALENEADTLGRQAAASPSVQPSKEGYGLQKEA